MSTTTEQTETTAATAADGTILISTPRFHQAQEIIPLVAALEAAIPFFEMPRHDLNVGPLNARKGVPIAFVIAAALTLANHDPVRSAAGMSAVELRDLLDFAQSYEGVANRLEALAHAARYVVALKRAEAGEEALQIYKATQVLTRFGRNTALSPSLREMRNALGLHKRKSRKPAPTVATPTP
ncbi:MAG: hypothetical protein JWO56_3628 [Acidobacteria bacterium]|nr:hypothetical protein [Acidobacteriota bacterium]